MKCIAAALVLMSAAAGFGAEKSEASKPAQSIAELQRRIEKILNDTKTPGVSVAIVHREGPEWAAGLGKAGVAGGRAATADTLFRIGSVSKAFTSLSVLLLVRQGRLSLDDPVRKMAPEIWFENRWESTDPVRVVHLLEHTTGWDDMHLRHYAKDARGMTTREGLDFDHESRVSRWRPGTRMSYSNTGPAVAAYIVEKITGQRIEDFVEQNLFRPIGMKTATYFQPPAEAATTLYHDDGKTPYPYWNILVRPSGSINASANDMAAYVQFYLNRGKANGVQIVPAAGIDRMENPVTNWAAQAGLKEGYGLSNYWSLQDGFVYHGHNGGLPGGLTEMAYMPQYNVGYFYSVNSGGGDGFEGIGKAIRAYITRGLQKPQPPPAAPLPSAAAAFAGWYLPDSPREEMTHYFFNLLGWNYVSVASGQLLFTSLNGWKNPFILVTGMLFRGVNKKDPPDPIPTLALVRPEEGRFAVFNGMFTLKRVPAWRALVQIGLTAFVLLALASSLVYAPFWLLGGLSRKRRRPAERRLRIWPLASIMILAAAFWIFNRDDENEIEHLGNLTAWSAGFFLSTIAFALASVASAIAIFRAPAQGVRPGVRLHASVVSAALLIATTYLALWGVIGTRTWV